MSAFIDNFLYLASSIAILLVIGFVGVVLWKMVEGTIDASALLSEPGQDGKPSLGRFQALVFTFVVAIPLLAMAAHGSSFPNIPNGVLLLLAGSGGTYLMSKHISKPRPNPQPHPAQPQQQQAVRPGAANPPNRPVG